MLISVSCEPTIFFRIIATVGLNGNTLLHHDPLLLKHSADKQQKTNKQGMPKSEKVA